MKALDGWRATTDVCLASDTSWRVDKLLPLPSCGVPVQALADSNGSPSRFRLGRICIRPLAMKLKRKMESRNEVMIFHSSLAHEPNCCKI